MRSRPRSDRYPDDDEPSTSSVHDDPRFIRASTSLRAGERNLERVRTQILREKYTGSELKNFDAEAWSQPIGVNVLSGTAITPPGSNIWNEVLQGPAATNRIGRRYLMQEVSFQGDITYTPLALDREQAKVRLIIFIDHHTNGTGNGALSQLLRDTTNAGNRINAFRDLNKAERYTVLHDKIFTLRPTTIDSADIMLAVKIPFDLHSNLAKHFYEVEVEAANVPNNYSIVMGAVASVANTRINVVSRLRFYG